MSNKKFLIITSSLLLIVSLVGCSNNPNQPGNESTGDAMMQENNNPMPENITEIAVSGKNFSFSPSEIKVKQGQKVKINFTSEQGNHDWVVDEFSARTEVVSTGNSSSVEFVADKVGTFEFYCSVGQHRALGMFGSLIVEDVKAMMDEPSTVNESKITVNKNEKDENDDSDIKDDSVSMRLNFSGQVIAGSNSPLLDFNQVDYDKAITSDKVVLLYFYANWCPICKEETVSALYPYFNELSGDDVIGFRVNYRDDQTDTNEEDLAKEFGIGYQHTKVILVNGKRVLKSPAGWEKTDYENEVAKYL